MGAAERTFLPHSVPAASATRPDSRPGTGPKFSPFSAAPAAVPGRSRTNVRFSLRHSAGSKPEHSFSRPPPQDRTQSQTFVPFHRSVKEKHSFTPLSAAVESKSKHSFHHGHAAHQQREQTFPTGSAAAQTPPDPRQRAGPAGRGCEPSGSGRPTGLHPGFHPAGPVPRRQAAR